MIRINLLPVRATKKREFGRQQLVLLALALLIAVGANLFWWRNVQSQELALDEQIERTRKEIATLEKTIGEVKSITQEKKALEGKLKILDDLKKNRAGPVKMMDELATIIPARVWLLGFAESGGQVKLTGAAVAYEDVSLFLKKLKGSKHFRDVVLGRVTQRANGVVEWDMTCVVDYSA
jgi:type IV pilus assembly protein PilN